MGNLTSFSKEHQKIREAMQSLFPGVENQRLRESMMSLNAACEQLKYVGRSIIESLVTARRKPLDEWEVYMYHSLNDAIGWLSKLETNMLEAGSELRTCMRRREQKKAESEDRKAEAEYAKQDLQRYEEHLFSLKKEEESPDVNRDGGKVFSGDVIGGREEGEGREDSGTVKRASAEEARTPGLVDREGSVDRSPIGEAGRIFGK